MCCTRIDEYKYFQYLCCLDRAIIGDLRILKYSKTFRQASKIILKQMQSSKELAKILIFLTQLHPVEVQGLEFLH
ncbi:hypothetical protein NIES25_37830 [Nostoc linckia NIES-25]|nr:hypothetical protein NIES25_37830 [Nostoc linckia NIES-25]